MDLQLIEQFLFDVREHFRASLETSEYENTSNLFHVTEAEATERLLQRCEQLLSQCTVRKTLIQSDGKSNGVNGSVIDRLDVGDYKSTITTTLTKTTLSHSTRSTIIAEEMDGDVSYLDMTACNKKNSNSKDYNDLNTSTDSDKTFRCSNRITSSKCGDTKVTHASFTEEKTTLSDEEHLTFDDDDNVDPEGRIYDICHVTDKDETVKVIVTEVEQLSAVNCPYMELPAGHLSIQNSSKYGQLQRIEKRLFFDQSKKCYCGILSDWLLCYADGPTACKPTLTVHLKTPGIEIEHSGDGKRRELCFQITTSDPSRKFVFQAINEVDAKEWIHAIEAAIRGDVPGKQTRKLPSPPVQKRLTFVGANGNGNGCEGAHTNGNDYIYEEPSPLYHVHEPKLLFIGKAANAKPPDLPDMSNDNNAMAYKFQYDVPKCPAQPLKGLPNAIQTESDTVVLLNTTLTEASPLSGSDSSLPAPKSISSSTEKLDFQTKIKDVHSKLSSQLSAGPNGPERLKKTVQKTYSSSSTESEAFALTVPTTLPITPSSKELKKQKKSNTPQTSPQKQNNNNNNNTNSSSEKSTKNWFLNRLNKSTSSVRNSSALSPAKCKQSEKENLLNSLEMCDNYEGADFQALNNSSNPTSPILKTVGGGGGAAGNGGKSKVNMIINQFEASGHLSMFSVETLAANAMASFSSFCDSDCNSYEPIMAVSTPPSSFMKHEKGLATARDISICNLLNDRL